ncbi:MAG: phosphoribosyltransferase, partial [Chitinophagia bacterium]|nr:phosphoribosyltransferase [Chitinophagia bacterium]
MFQDRADAGRALAHLLTKYSGRPGVVLAVPRGGVPVGAEVARALGMPLEPLLSKKIGHPLNPEYAIGAVTMEDRLLSERTGVSDVYVDAETHRLRQAMHEQMLRLTEGRKSRPIEGITVIVVDDGIATGSTLLCSLPMLRRRKPAKIVVAVPVAPPEALERLRAVADEVICLQTAESFSGVGAFYADFQQVEDAEAAEILRSVESRVPPGF